MLIKGVFLNMLCCVLQIAAAIHDGGRSVSEVEEVIKPKNVGQNNYLLRLARAHHYIDLVPSTKFIAPGAVLERWSASSPGAQLSKAHFERLTPPLCHYHGKVRGQPTSSVAISTCNGLAGFVRSDDGTYLIEPIDRSVRSAEEDLHTVRWFNPDSQNNKSKCILCDKPNFEKQSFQYDEAPISKRLNHESTHPTNLYQKIIELGVSKWEGQDAESVEKLDGQDSENGAQNYNQLGPLVGETLNGKTSSSRPGPKKTEKPLFLETLLVIDKPLVESFKDSELENFVLTVFNMARNLLHDRSLDQLIDLQLVRMIRFDKDIDNMNLGYNADPKEALSAFAEWQNCINPIDDSHPNHHDLAVLLTRPINGSLNSDVLGLARKFGTCDPLNQAVICQDCGLRLGYIMAHQIGHAEGFGDCLRDEPADHNFNIPGILPGVMYGPDFQCKQLIDSRARECSIGSTCRSLNCELDNHTCLKTGIPPATGTTCGFKKWCYNLECVGEGVRLSAVDGNWGSWSPWSECSRTCGSGVASAKRECNNPQPKHGGRECLGLRKRHKICSTKPCQIGSPPFRDVQCAEFNNWIFPEDGEIHTWKGAYIHGENPCVLFCINEKNVVASLKPKVKDGTTCYRGMRDICIAGLCKEIPCDLNLESKAVEDVCGECHGNGTECMLAQGVQHFSRPGIKNVIMIPQGTRNVRVEAAVPTSAHFIVKDGVSNDTYNQGKKLGMFKLPGSQAWLGMIKPNQEVLNIPGPLEAALLVQVYVHEPVDVKYSMGVPSEPRIGSYSWDYVDWTKCSAQCGPGIQVSVPKCTESIGGLVEDKYCNSSDRLPEKTRVCNLGPCTPRWLIGDWQECKPCPSNNARHYRAVNCVIPVGEGEGESNFVDDRLCRGTKPICEEPCDCRSKRQTAYKIFSNARRISNEYFPLIVKDFVQLKPLLEISQFHKKFLPPTQSPEKKITLMQLEEEMEGSLKKQYKENELKNALPIVLKDRYHFNHTFAENTRFFPQCLGKKANKAKGVFQGKHFVLKQSNPHKRWSSNEVTELLNGSLRYYHPEKLHQNEDPFSTLVKSAYIKNCRGQDLLDRNQRMEVIRDHFEKVPENFLRNALLLMKTDGDVHEAPISSKTWQLPKPIRIYLSECTNQTPVFMDSCPDYLKKVIKKIIKETYNKTHNIYN